MTVWTVLPKGYDQELMEGAFDENNATDIAFDWSIELGGHPVVIFCNSIPWNEVVA